MALTIEHICPEISPWDHISCPVCGSRDFTSLDHAAVFCNGCNARFQARRTSGEPGFVVALVGIEYLEESYKDRAAQICRYGAPTFVHIVGERDCGWMASGSLGKVVFVAPPPVPEEK